MHMHTDTHFHINKKVKGKIQLNHHTMNLIDFDKGILQKPSLEI